jgi:signal transduction histidine kinase
MARCESYIMDDAPLRQSGGPRSLAPRAMTLLGVVLGGAALVWVGAGGAGWIGRGSLAVVAVALLISGRALVCARRLAAKASNSLRFERAVATASGALLKRDVADPVGTALGALLDGVDVEAVFLETNSDEPPDEHGNTATVRDILYGDDPDGHPGRWELTGWRVGSDGKQALGAGLEYVTAISRLDPMTIAYYRAMQIRSEVLLPITVEGRWIGSIGFLSRDQQRAWTPDEKRLLRSTAEMIGAYWERRDARGKLEELLASKDEFIASVSHEVRTPLTAVVGFAAELDENRDKFSEEEQADLISLLSAQSREVADIVDDLLTAARAQAGTLAIRPEAVGVRKLLGEVLSSHSGRVDLVMNEDIEVWADGGRVRQIMRNLLTNADRYGGDIVKIHILRTGDGIVRLEVRDNGEGIPYHLRHHIFEPYARANSSSTQPASVGLGLSVARQLARLMDGELVLSDQDGWTVFTLSLPAAPVSQPAGIG